MSLTLALLNIRACWERNFATTTCTDSTKNKLYKAIGDLEKSYNDQVQEINASTKSKGFDITLANKNLCCISDECLENIHELSKQLGCESNGQVQAKTINKIARPGAVNIRPNKIGSY